MNRILFKEFGNYIPSFFYMKINVTEDLEDLNIISDEASATFYHEYVHFLQDLFTTFGLTNIQQNVEIIKEITGEIYRSQSPDFQIPYVPIDTSLTQKHRDMFSLFYGDWEYYNYVRILDVRTEKNGLIPKLEHLEEINLYVSNLKGETKWISFGAVSLLEYIAYCIENVHFNVTGHPEYPYKTPELLANYLYPHNGFNTEVLVAISEISLHTMHPGKLFVDILSRLHSKLLKPKNRTDIIEFCKEYNLTNKGKKFTFDEVYYEYLNTVENSLKDYFTSDIISEAKEWIGFVFKQVKTEKSNFSFTNFLGNNGLNEIKRLFTKIGSPIISNQLEKQYLHIPFNDNQSDLNVPLFKAIEEIYSVLFGYRTNCNLKMHCQYKTDFTIVNSNCDNSPWNKVYEEKLCPFAIMWKTWGLSEKKPIVN